MNERFEDISHRLKAIEEDQLEMVRKIAEGEVRVKLEKNLNFENGFSGAKPWSYNCVVNNK